MSTYFKRTRVLAAAALLLALAMAFGLASTSKAYAEQQMKIGSIDETLLDSQGAATVDDVLAAIGQLSIDPRDFSVADVDCVEAIQADYEALSAEDQATIDSTFNHPSGDKQSCGRILESAVWAVRSFNTNAITTLDNGAYPATVVTSMSDKGKSDSSRVRQWWVESVEVVDGQATAYIYVTEEMDPNAPKSDSYPSVWIGGQTIDRDANNNYAIPVDLNGVTYFGGISSKMPRPIMYALSTTVVEPDVTLSVTKEEGLMQNIGLTATISASGMLTTTTTKDSYSHAFVGGIADAPADPAVVGSGAVQLDKSTSPYEFHLAMPGVDGDFAVCFYSTKSGWFERKVTLDFAARTLYLATSRADYAAVDAAINAAPTEQGGYTDASWQVLQAAINAVVRDKLFSQQAEVDDMAKAINDAIGALVVLVDKPVAKTGLVYNGKAQTAVATGAGYTVSNGSATAAGTYKATAKLKPGYVWLDGTDADVTVGFTIAKATIAVPRAATGLVYNGKAKTGVAGGANYTVKNGSATNAGNYTATLTAKPNYQFTGAKATASVKWSIAKAANLLKLAKATRTVKASKVAKANKVVLGAKVSKKGQGAVTYVKKSVNKKKFKKNFTVNKKTGKITVKKGTPKGIYKVTVKATAAGNANYNKSTAKTAVVTIKVK